MRPSHLLQNVGTPQRSLLLAADPANDGQEQGSEREAVRQHASRISALTVSSGRGRTNETVPADTRRARPQVTGPDGIVRARAD